MRGCCASFSLLCALGVAAPGQTNHPARTVRQYDGRVQMHTAPSSLYVPDEKAEAEKGAPDSVDRDMVVPDNLLPESQLRPAGPRIKDLERKQKKDWLVPPSTEPQEGNILSAPADKSDSSGWGWLADDVLHRQKQEEKNAEKEKKNDSEKTDTSFAAPSSLPKDSGDGRSQDSWMDTSFKPVAASTPTRVKDKTDAGNVSATDKPADTQAGRKDKSATAEHRIKKPADDQKIERAFSADSAWGKESLWDRDNRSVNGLPRTEALLSINKLDTRKPGDDTGLRGLKPDAGKAVADKAGLSPSTTTRRNLDIAGGYQPMPTAPVNDFGTTPWADGLPGKTPLGGSSTIGPEPSVTPSRPAESLAAPALPTPVADPWLR